MPLTLPHPIGEGCSGLLLGCGFLGRSSFLGCSFLGGSSLFGNFLGLGFLSLGFLSSLDLLRSNLLGSRLLLGLGLLETKLSAALMSEHCHMQSQLHNAGIAALTIGEQALLNLLENLANELFVVAKSCDSETTGMQVALLRQVMILSTSGRISLARDSTVLMRSFRKKGFLQAALHSLSVAQSVPSLRPFLLCLMISVSYCFKLRSMEMSLSFTSSMDFAPKFLMFSRSFSENSTS